MDEGRKGVLLVGLLTVITLFVIIIPGVMSIELFPDLDRPDMVYPNMILNLLPNALIGFMIAAMVAALTSSLSGLLNSVATLFTIDFYLKMKPDTSSSKQVTVGRIVSVVVLVIAVFWAPQIGQRFGTLLKYYQEMLSMMAPPIVAAFILGIFWKRTNWQGAFIGLIGGVALGVVNLVAKISFGSSIFGDMHFLLTVPFYLLFSMTIMIVTSLLTTAPDYEKIGEYMYSKAAFNEETRQLKSVKWYDNYRYLSYLLLFVCLVILFIYR